MNDIPELVKKYRTQQNVNLRQFAEAISNALGEPLTKQAVHQWQHGVTRPDKFALVKLVMKSHDWTFDFANECLAVLDPNWRN